MHYHVYNTPGFILGSKASGEASRFIYIYTKELGLVGAHAQNTRSVNSKLRYALDAPALATVSLVRGKNMWRLKSAVPEKRYASVFKEDQEKLQLCARVFALIRTLVAGEEANPELFDLVHGFLEFIEKDFNGNVSGDSAAADIKNAEAVLILRVLHMLGYIPDSELAQQFAYGNEWSADIVKAMATHKKEAILVINESLRASGL